MRVLKKKTLDNYGDSHPDAAASLMIWYRSMKKCEAKNLPELRNTFGSADPVGRNKDYACFNIKGNDYRLIADVLYVTQHVYIQEVLTHDEYTDKYVKRKKRK